MHKKMHIQNEKFKCPRCSYSSKKQQNVDLHLKKDHKDGGDGSATLNLVAPRKKIAHETAELLDQEQLDMPMEGTR